MRDPKRSLLEDQAPSVSPKRRARTGGARPLGALSLGLSIMLAAIGCGESSYDVYMRGLKQMGAAESQFCQMKVDGGSMVINSETIIACLEANRDALRTLEQAQSMGFTGKDVDRTLLQLRDKIAKLESRRSVVGYMEREG